MTTTKKTAENANPFEALTTFGPDSFKEGYEKFAEGASDFADFQKKSFDAAVASSNAYAKGFEKIVAAQNAFVKSVFEDGVAAAKEAASADSPQAAFDANAKYASDAVEKNLQHTQKVADLWIETNKQTVEPLTARYSEIVEKIQTYRP